MTCNVKFHTGLQVYLETSLIIPAAQSFHKRGALELQSAGTQFVIKGKGDVFYTVWNLSLCHDLSFRFTHKNVYYLVPRLLPLLPITVFDYI